MSRPVRIAFLVILVVLTAVPAASSAAAPKPQIGSAIVFQRGFDIMYWDSFNGLRRVGRGDEPAISSNGRYVTYQRRGGAGCQTSCGTCGPADRHSATRAERMTSLWFVAYS